MPRWVIGVAGAVVAMLVGGLVVVVARAESPPTAPEALAMAKRFVEEADSVEYRGEARAEYSDPEFPEDDSTERSSFEEAAVFPDRSHSLLEYEDAANETILIDGVSYDRVADSRQALDDELWIRYDLGGDQVDEQFVVSGVLVSPSVLPDLIEAADGARLLSQSGDRSVLRTHVDTDALEGIYYPRVRLDLVVEDDGRITEMRLLASDEYETRQAVVEIERWNGDVEIDAPDDADIDTTPSIDEEDVAAFDDAPLFQPRVLPTDFALAAAFVVTEGEFGAEGEQVACDQVNLYFSDPNAFDDIDDEELPTSTYLDVYEFPTSCSDERPDAAADFVAGSYSGWIEDDDGYRHGQISVGDTVVEFNTDLDVATLMATFADLVPLDFATLPVAPEPVGD
jgi:hypothetical protein